MATSVGRELCPVRRDLVHHLGRPQDREKSAVGSPYFPDGGLDWGLIGPVIINDQDTPNAVSDGAS